ncbi:unnamed protein product [Symbiodinium natans]|uniref:Uncharacterized protein n=1 Tax=Symbiodinium natans TaxID=878477 RepID=A0A812U5Y6_9DINO|nr:unnamed protein product [Symbiodinium natans]
MAVEVTYVVQLKTEQHPEGLVAPSDLVVEYKEKKYLKLLGSHHWLVRLICPELYKRHRNPSIATTKTMKDLTQAAVNAFVKMGEEQEDLFEGVADSKKAPLKRKRSCVESGVKTVTLPDYSTAEFYMDQHHSCCPAVLLEPKSLEAVLGYLRGCCEECEKSATRAYNKTGKFKKK